MRTAEYALVTIFAVALAIAFAAWVGSAISASLEAAAARIEAPR